jgi:hypothetical protein
MSTAPRETLLAIVEAASGLSTLGNAYLEQNIFNTGKPALSSWSEREVSGVIQVAIDTPGLGNNPQTNAVSIHDIVECLKKYSHGITAIAFVRRMQSPLLSSACKKLLRLLCDIFSDPLFWNHVMLVFTHAGAATTE